MQGIKILSRFLFVSSAVFGLSTIANWNEWNQYWNGTLRRVQTVDFNILSHTLPAKLSSVLANKNYRELQRTLDSNYGLFGIVVTDCTKVDLLCQEQKITFASNGRRDWKVVEAPSNLPNHPFDLLRTPSPLITEKSYEKPSSEEQILTKEVNKGVVIGRVYYVRGTAPDFRSDYISWLSNLWSTKGSHGFYALKAGSLIGIGLTVWLSIEFILYKKRIERQQAIQEQERLQEELSKEINRNTGFLTKQKSLIAQQKESCINLECTKKTYEQQIEYLNTEISQLTSLQSQQQIEAQDISQLLLIRQEELKADRNSGNFSQEQLLQKESEVLQLQQRICVLENQKQVFKSKYSRAIQRLSAMSQGLSDADKKIKNLETKINELSLERDKSLKDADEFKQKLDVTIDVAGLTLVLRAVQLETTRTEELHEQTKQFIESLYEDERKENSNLKRERDNLQLKFLELEDQLELLKRLDNSSIIDLSSISMALVGGEQHTRQNVIQKLSKSYNFKKIIEVPTTDEKSANTKSVKEAIRNCHLIAIITGSIGHDLTDIISSLRASGDLQGEIIYLNTTGVSSISRDISKHLDKLNIQHNLN